MFHQNFTYELYPWALVLYVTGLFIIVTLSSTSR